jgi:hypothetical protein
VNLNAMNFKPIGQAATPSPQARFGNLHTELQTLAREVAREDALMGYSRTIAASKTANQALNIIREYEAAGKGESFFTCDAIRRNYLLARGESLGNTPREVELTLDALVLTGQLYKFPCRGVGNTETYYTTNSRGRLSRSL